MTNDELLSKTISYLRFPLTVGVVFIHFNIAKDVFSMQGVKYGLNNADWYYFVINFFSDVLPRVGVPLFFLISGFLFFYRKEFNTTIYKKKISNRMVTLVLPYFLWNIVAILITLFHQLPFLSSVFPNAGKTNVIISPVRLFYTFFANYINEGIFVTPDIGGGISELSQDPYPIDGPMWYVRDLIVMVILSPVIYYFIKKTGKLGVAILGLSWFFIRPLLGFGYLTMFLTASFFFSMGAYFSIKRINFVNYMRKMKYSPFLYLFICVADTLTKRTEYNFFIHNVGILAGVVSVVVIVSLLIEKKWVKVSNTLANGSFFVYALHILIIHDIAKLMFKILHLEDNTYSMLFLYFAVPIITTIVCVFVYVSLKRFCPRVCSLLTGGR